MKKQHSFTAITLAFLLAFLTNSPVLIAQNCLPGGITFTTQAEVDAFPTNYPGCTNIEGNVTINDGDNNAFITNLNGLSNVTSIGGNLEVFSGCDGLINLNGLNNLTTVGGRLNIYDCDGLISLNGLNNLTSIGGRMDIHASDALVNLAGLDNLLSVGGICQVHSNDAQTSMDGLGSLASVGGDFDIYDNPLLTNLDGLESLTTIGDGLAIFLNPLLSVCNAQGICDYLANPANPASIHDNALGCDSRTEVEITCANPDCPVNVVLATQAEVDAFALNYPNCTMMSGNVTINDGDNNAFITNLNGLSNITSIGGNLILHLGCDGLTNLNGLNNLTSIGGDLFIFDCDAMLNLSGLDNLTTIGGYMRIYASDALVNLAGLDNLLSVGEYCAVHSNDVLTNFDGLGSLNSVGEDFEVYDNALLTNLNGVASLTTIGGLDIFENPLLSVCNAQSICDYLANPANPASIHDNALGCDSRTEVETACTGCPYDADGDGIWTGCTSTDWDEPTNWLNGSVPDATDDVTIPNVTNDPVIMGGTAAVAKSVSVNTSASLTINDMGSLTINGFSLHGTSTGLYNRGTVTNSGDIILGSTASVGYYGIWNLGTFNNNTGGAIHIDRSTNFGLFNFSGTFTNHATITIGAVASVGSRAIRNNAIFNNSPCAALINIVSNSFISNIGTFTNAGSIIENASGNSNITTNTGVIQNLNGGTFATGGTAAITTTGDIWTGCTSTDWATATNWLDQSVPTATDNVTISNVTNDPVIMGGTAAVTNSVSVNASASLTIDDMGSLTINGSSSHGGATAGLYNQGTVANSGDIIIGSTASVGHYGLWNLATFNNSASGGSGEISIDQSSLVGLYNEFGTFTNAAKITIGAVSSVGSYGMINKATFNNNSNGEISIDRSSLRGLWNNAGAFTNAAKITIGAVASAGSDGIKNESTMNNNSGGEISIDRSSGIGLSNASGTFTNAAKITIGAVASVGFYGMTNQATFNNSASGGSGEISIDRSSTYGLWNFTGTLTNAAKITIGATASVGENGILNSATFNNSTCALLSIFAPLSNFSTFGNSGLFTVNTADAHANSGTLTNNGIIEYPQGNPIPSVTNNEIIIAPTTFNGCKVISPAFSIGSPVDFSIVGVFTDAAATLSAGTYVVGTNTFTASPILAEGTHNLFVKIEAVGGGCTRIVPWQLTTQNCCDAPVAICKPATVVLVGNSATVTAPQVDNGSTAECGLQSSTVSPNTFNCSHLGTPQTVTLTVTDINSDSDECQATVTVLDQTPPTITCPGNIAKNTDPGLCTAVTTYAVTASDNCSYTLTRTAGLASGAAFPKGPTTVEWKVTDTGGSMTTCAFTVTVTDAQPPSITCPSNIVRSNDPNLCSASVTYATPTASDNCALAANQPVWISGGTTPTTNGANSTSTFDKGTTTVEWKASDTAIPANVKSCTFTVTVNDTQKPSITCPANKTQGTDPGECEADVTYLTPTAADNCGLPTDQPAWSSGGTMPTASGLNSISTFQKGVTTVTWKATDASGNTKTCTFKITVNDLEKPTMTCLSDINVNNDAGLCSAVVAYTLPTFTDNCPPTSGTSVKISGPASGSAFPVGTSNVVYRATDASGNTKQCTLKVIVTDNQPPSITCPGPIVVTGSGTPCTAAVSYAVPTASDNCAGSLTPFLLSGLASGSQFPAGVTTNTWRAIAGNGQSTDCSFTVTVECPDGMMNGGVINDESRDMNQRFQVSETWKVLEPAPSMRLVPNPATTQVEIWVGGTGSERLGIEEEGEAAGRDLSVFDAQGRMVWQRTLELGEEMVLFDFATKNLADGLYFVMLRSEGAALTKRLLVCNAPAWR